MLKIFMEQLALIGALSALVMAAFWPHAKFLVLPLLDWFVESQHSTQLDNNQERHDSSRRLIDRRPIEDHPRLGGRALRRQVSEKETITRRAYNSFAGYGQSQMASEQSFLALQQQQQNQQHRHHRASAFVDGGGDLFQTFVQNNQSSPKGIQSMSFALIMACVMGLIMFVIMKLLTSRFGTSHNCKRNASNNMRNSTRARTTDLRQDKRRLARLSREERARQLILHHGSKNVSRAMRFLIGELEKQKQQLLAEGPGNMNQLDETTTMSESCFCSCHPKG